MRADPKFAAPYFLLGDVFAREGQHRQAAPLLRKALELSPSDVDAAVALSRALAGLEDRTASLTILEAARQHNPRDPRLALELSRIYQKQGETDRARQYAVLAASLKQEHRKTPASLLDRQ